MHVYAPHFRFFLVEIERNTIAVLVVAVVRRKERLAAKITKAATSRGAASVCVFDFSKIAARGVVAGSLETRVAPKHPVLNTVFQPAACRTLGIIGSGDTGKISA